MAKFADKNPDSYYDYIELDKELWYENPQAKEKSGEIILKEVPYLKSVVAQKDSKKRTVKFKNDFSCEFYKTLQVINGTDINVNDMASTEDINEVDLLLNLKNRLKATDKAETFTNVGSTLLIVNPFQYLKGVYGKDVINYFIDSHERNNPDQREELLEPHLYDVVLISIRELLKANSLNQALVISGESGAGKTEAAKNAMQCITQFFSSKFNSSSHKAPQDNAEPLENQILNCNPILEAFGNAKTVRNDNSSRFGKYVKIKLNAKSFIIEGAMIKTYLLEKSRISELSLLERNYHIFYMFINGTAEADLAKYHIVKDMTKYKYLYKGPSQIYQVDKLNDAALHKELLACFVSTGFNSEELNTIFKLLAVVLQLGNLEIKKKNSKDISILTPDVFDHIAELLQVDKAFLLNNLTKKPPSKHIKEWGSIYDDKVIKNFIDSIAKDFYNKLFLWIVAKLNNKLYQKTKEKQKYFGLLDIFGFECFQRNSLEQLCINYTNEQLQQLFIKDIFEADKEEFRKEGLESKLHLLDATFKDNKDIIKSIEAFFYLTKSDATDERVYSTASNFAKEIEKPDKSRLDKLKGIGENKITTERKNKDEFRVMHTAKDVSYSTQGWAEKNIDEIKNSMLDCLFESKNEIIQMIFTTTTNMQDHEAEIKKIKEEREQGSQTKELRKYLGSKFQMDMEALKASLEKCSHHYIRCIKPNEVKEALLFWDNFVFNQIQYLGILSTIQVRKSGFPVRRKYSDFYESFKLTLNDYRDVKTDEFYHNKTKEIIHALMTSSISDFGSQCLFGRSKVYMKQLFSASLERAKEKVITDKRNWLDIIKVGYIKVRKDSKRASVASAITSFQSFYQINRKGLQIKAKKKQVALIQAVYLANKGREAIKAYITHLQTVMNFIKIIPSQKVVEEKRMKMEYVVIRVQMYLSQIKQVHRRKVTAITKAVMNDIKQKIMQKEFNSLWLTVHPFMLRLLTRKKYDSLYKKAKLESKKLLTTEALKLFQQRNLASKVLSVKRKAKTILTFGYTSMITNYYSALITNVGVIQQYLHRIIDKASVRNKVFIDYLSNEDEDFSEQHIAIDRALFPSMFLSNEEGTEEKNKRKRAMDYFNRCYQTNTNQLASADNDNRMHFGREPLHLTPSYEHSNHILQTLPNSRDEKLIKKRMNTKPGHKAKLREMIGLYPINQCSDDKISFFARIADVDIITFDKDNDLASWTREFDRVFKVNMLNNTPIQLIYAGNCHSIVVNSKGQIFSWGWNHHGQCGVTRNSFLSELPDSVSDQSEVKQTSLPIAYYAHVNMPIQLDHLGKVNKVLVGEDFTISLNTEKSILMFGDNSKGQLGQGDKKAYHTRKTLSSDFKNKVVDIQSTEDMNAVLLDSNELYVWFMGNERRVNCKPCLLYLDKKVTISQIACGKSFMIILGKNGLVYGCGSNCHGELASPNDERRLLTPVELLAVTNYKERIIQVRCGFKHVVCVSSNGNAYTWGNNTFGQLGLPLKPNQKVNQIKLQDSQGQQEKILQIAAGYRSSLFFTEKREIYHCGILSLTNSSSTPIKFNLGLKLEELSQINTFTPVRIMTSWNRSFSLFYISFADIRHIYKAYNNIHKINKIINQLAEKWISDTVLCPFIPQIAKHFCSQLVQK